MQCITRLISADEKDEQFEEKLNQFKLILSVYKECCKVVYWIASDLQENSSSFMRLFIPDRQTTDLELVLERCESKTDVEEEEDVIEEVKDVTTEEPESVPSSETQPTKEEVKTEEKSIKKKEKRCGEYLWILLTRLVLSQSLSFDLKVYFFFPMHV